MQTDETEVTRAGVGVCLLLPYLPTSNSSTGAVVHKVRLKGSVCSQAAQDKRWLPGSVEQASLLLKIKSGKQKVI